MGIGMENKGDFAVAVQQSGIKNSGAGWTR